jgi:hypothetical protein
MGIISGSSKIAPLPPLPSLPPPSPPVVQQEEEKQSEEQINAEARRKSLLRRSRGRFGTVLTGFKGFLSQSNNDSRKTLLGE